MKALDEFDRQLLDLLQINSRTTGQELSEKVGLSPAACLRRVQRLREDGIIEREVAVLSPDVAGQSVTIIVLLTVARDRPDRVDKLKMKLLALPEVKRFYHVTGEADYVLTVVCKTMEAYANFTEAHFYEPYIKGFESMVVLREWQT